MLLLFQNNNNLLNIKREKLTVISYTVVLQKTLLNIVTAMSSNAYAVVTAVFIFVFLRVKADDEYGEHNSHSGTCPPWQKRPCELTSDELESKRCNSDQDCVPEEKCCSVNICGKICMPPMSDPCEYKRCGQCYRCKTLSDKDAVCVRISGCNETRKPLPQTCAEAKCGRGCHCENADAGVRCVNDNPVEQFSCDRNL